MTAAIDQVPLLGPMAAGLIAGPVAFATQPTWVALMLIAVPAIPGDQRHTAERRAAAE